MRTMQSILCEHLDRRFRYDKSHHYKKERGVFVLYLQRSCGAWERRISQTGA